jgi:hypothetical protein
MVYERRQTRYTFWSWPEREEMIDNPIEDESTHNMPKKIECNVFWPIIFDRNTVEPKSHKEYSKEYWFEVREEQYTSLKPY